MFFKYSLNKILLATVLITAFFIAGDVFAGDPSIISFILNESSSNATFNPNNEEKVLITISTDIPVKFNTVAICMASDTVCSRTTSVKYFTQTSSFLNSLSKEWDGKTGGTNPSIVEAGEYKVKATIKDESGVENIQFGQYSIFVDFSGISTTTSTTTYSTGTTTQSTSTSQTATTTNTQVVTKTIVKYVSTHSSPEDLSEYSGISKFEISAGRERVGYVGTPIKFNAKNNLSKNSSCSYAWVYGDGSKDIGQSISHVYKFPGEYNVVLNGDCGDGAAVSRTKVKILRPEINFNLISSGDLDIYNFGKMEINMGGWMVESSSTKFIFPEDTIISASGKITIPKEYSKVYTNNNEIINLINPSDEIVSSIKGYIINNEPVVPSSTESLNIKISKEEVENFKNAFLQNSKEASPKLTLDMVTPKNISETAAVFDSVKNEETKGFWKNLFGLPVKGIKAVARVFYDIE